MIPKIGDQVVVTSGHPMWVGRVADTRWSLGVLSYLVVPTPWLGEPGVWVALQDLQVFTL
jgi:hypothetical protein